MPVDAVRLAEAKLALHNLMTGKMASVVVDQNGERVEFSRTNVKDLLAYITALEAGGLGALKTKPLGFVF